ncbi:MAG: hypothetical protein FJ098_00100 [Deltaproteobacteria bacterium]|nr:hypothetical protein [Deltaproteobacteria bacterium]
MRHAPGTLTVLALLLSLSSAATAKDTPQEVQLWAYATTTGVVAPHWAVTLMPGLRWEVWDSEGEAGQATMVELFAGPSFVQKWGAVTLKIPLWYYYMGFPIRKPGPDDWFDSHNLELIPIVEYRLGRWTFTSRSILHNKVYARNTVFRSDAQRRGYSLLWRQLFQAAYTVAAGVDVVLAEELFLGLVEDGETNGLAKGEPFFEKHGLSMNRVYAGVSLTLPHGMSLSPQYVFETHHDPDHGTEVTKMRHYLLVTWSTTVQLFSR